MTLVGQGFSKHRFPCTYRLRPKLENVGSIVHPMNPLARSALAVSAAVVAAYMAWKVSFTWGMYSIRNSTDGQAGMGPFFGSLLVGLVAAIFAVFFVVWWTSRDRKK